MREHFPVVNGEKVENTEWVIIANPYNGAGVAKVHRAGRAIIEAAVTNSLEAYQTFRATPAWERSEFLRRIAEGIADERVELAAIIKEEAGKPITLALAEVDRTVQTFKCAAEEATRIEGELIPFDSVRLGAGRFGLTRRFPIGPVLAISPFNFPLNLVAHKVAPALAAGNTVVLKPASQTPSVAIRLAEIALAAGVPKGVFNVIPCSREVADELVVDPRFKALSFTGSATVGWSLKARAGMKKVTLELGGNAAAIVEPDADLEDAARKLCVGAFAYAGQICISVQRIFVHESIEQEFLALLVANVTKPGLWGNPDEPGTICGPMIDAANVERIISWVEEAVSMGGKLVCGGVKQGSIVTPAVLYQVPKSARIVAEEAFGPVVVVDSYRTFDEALAKANDSRYGLQAGLYSNDVTKVMKAFKVLDVGAVIHNDYPTYRIDAMPYGGVKESGFGREGLRYAIEELTELKLLVLRE